MIIKISITHQNNNFEMVGNSVEFAELYVHSYFPFIGKLLIDFLLPVYLLAELL